MSTLHYAVSVVLRRTVLSFIPFAAVSAVVLCPAFGQDLTADQPSKKGDGASLDQLVGIGAALKKGETGFEVFLVVPSSPAQLSGELEVGDVIVAVAEAADPPKTVDGLELSEVVGLIRGSVGTEVRLTVIPKENRFVKRKVISIIRESLQGGRLVGKELPEAKFITLVDGRTQDMSELRGKVVLLDFWSMSCAPCIEHIDEMQNYFKKHPQWSGRVELISISVDQDRRAAEKFVIEKGWTTTKNLWVDQSAKSTLDAHVIPMVMIIGADGNVVATGHPRSANLPKLVDGLLASVKPR